MIIAVALLAGPTEFGLPPSNMKGAFGNEGALLFFCIIFLILLLILIMIMRRTSFAAKQRFFNTWA
jgi:hypothetical protein